MAATHDRRRRLSLSGLRPLGLVGLCLLSVAPGTTQAAELTQAAPISIPDGFWEVRGRGVSGTKCGDWFVRLTSRQGRLTGVVGVWAGNSPLQNLSVSADGSFSGNTAAGWNGSRMLRAYQVAGRFVDNAVSLTLENEVCPARSGRAIRSGRV